MCLFNIVYAGVIVSAGLYFLPLNPVGHVHFCRFVFTALHVMQTRYSEDNSVCLSVRPSDCHTRDP